MKNSRLLQAVCLAGLVGGVTAVATDCFAPTDGTQSSSATVRIETTAKSGQLQSTPPGPGTEGAESGRLFDRPIDQPIIFYDNPSPEFKRDFIHNPDRHDNHKTEVAWWAKDQEDYNLFVRHIAWMKQQLYKLLEEIADDISSASPSNKYQAVLNKKADMLEKAIAAYEAEAEAIRLALIAEGHFHEPE